MSQFLLRSHGVGNRADSTPGGAAWVGGWRKSLERSSPPHSIFFSLEPLVSPSFRLPGAQKGTSGLCAPQHVVNPVHIHGHPSEEIGELEGGALADHEGVHSMKNAIADQGAARVSLR